MTEAVGAVGGSEAAGGLGAIANVIPAAAGTIFTHGMSMIEASKQRRFQAYMSNTAHQREVKDLIAAGLNPALSAKLGGSSTPLGVSAQVPDYAAPVRDGMAAYSAAIAARLQQAQTRNLDADSSNKELQNRVGIATEREQIEMTVQNLENLRRSGDLTSAQEEEVEQKIANLKGTLKLLGFQASHSAYDLDRARVESEFFKGRFGSSAIARKHLGAVPGYVSTAGAAYQRAKEFGGEYLDSVIERAFRKLGKKRP